MTHEEILQGKSTSELLEIFQFSRKLLLKNNGGAKPIANDLKEARRFVSNVLDYIRIRTAINTTLILTGCREFKYLRWRYILVGALLVKFPDLSLKEVATLVGYKEHDRAIYARTRNQHLCYSNPKYLSDYENVLKIN